MAEFDPYYEWLGVPPDEQPPNHYRLLGVPLFEPKDDVIANAADRQMAYVRTFQTGTHYRESQKVLNELSTARRCLLDPERRKAYDAELRLAITPDPLLSPAQTRLIPLPEALRPGQASPVQEQRPDREPTGEMKSSLPALLVAAGLLLVLLVVTLVIYANYMGGGSSPRKPIANVPVVPPDNPPNGVDPNPKPPVPPDPVPKAPDSERPTSEYPLLTTEELQRQRAIDSTKLEIRERGLNAALVQSLARSIETTELRFEKTDINDADLAILAKLKGLQKLAIVEAPVSNEGLLHLQGLKRLKSLELANVNATSQGAVELAAGLPELRELSIDTLVIEPKAIELLSDRCPLTYFSACSTKLSDDDLGQLCQMSSLNSLRLADTSITSAGLFDLRQLPKLQTLDVGQNKQIDNVALSLLVHCPSLKALSLEKTAIDDAGSEYLLQMKQLMALDLTGCNLSPQALKKLRGRLPTCKITPAGPTEVASTNGNVNNTSNPTENPVEPVELLPAPSAEEQKAADARVREAYGEEIDAAKTAAAKIAIAEKLSEQVPANKDDPAAVYVLLRLSSQLSAEGGDLLRSFAAADAMDRQFEVDIVKIKAFLLDKAAEAAKDNLARQSMISLAFDVADAAIARERYKTAGEVVRHITALNAKLKEADVVRQLRLLNDRLQEVTRLWEAAQSAEETLATNPSNADAHLAVARYLAMGRGQWEAAREHFAQGSDDDLKAIAAQETEAGEDPRLMLAVADAWWRAGEALKPPEKEAWQERAGQWYQKALPGLNGLDRTKAEKRIAALGDDSTGPDGTRPRPGPGMIGRATVDDADAGIVFIYHPGKCIRTSDLEQALGVKLASHRVQIVLTGAIELRDDTQTGVWHVCGAGSSQVLIDGRPLSLLTEVAIQRNVTPIVPLRKGPHTLTWVLMGGDLGACSLLLPYDTATGKPLSVNVTKQLLTAQTAKKGGKKVDLASSEGLPKNPPGLKP